MRNKEWDHLTGSGYWYEGAYLFERTLADGTHEIIVGPSGCQEYDDFLAPISDELKEKYATRKRWYPDAGVRETDKELSLNPTYLELVLDEQRKIDTVTSNVLNENCND